MPKVMKFVKRHNYCNLAHSTGKDFNKSTGVLCTCTSNDIICRTYNLCIGCFLSSYL